MNARSLGLLTVVWLMIPGQGMPQEGAARIIERKQEVLESLQRARTGAAQIGADAIVGSDVERLSRRLSEITAPEATGAGPLRAEEQLIALSRVAQEAANLARSIGIFDGGKGLTLRGSKVTDLWLKDSKKLSGFTRVNLAATGVTDAGLASLKGLELQTMALASKGVTGSGLAALSGAKLWELELSGSGVHDAALVHLERFPELLRLGLSHTPVTSAGLAHVAKASKLVSLGLDGTATTDDGLIHLRGLTSLSELSLQGTRVTGKGLEHIRNLKSLSTLNLQDTRVTDAGLEALGLLSNLETLNLGGTDIIGTGLAGLGGLEKLVVLNLTGTRINDSALTGLGKLASLRRLELSSTRITDTSLARLAAPGHLNYLDIYGTNVTDAGLRHLANQRDLKQLYLGGTAATDATAAVFKGMGGLERLDLRGTRVSDAGLEALAGLKELNTLILAGTPITGSGLARLKGLEALGTLDLGGTEVGDDALAHAASLRNLRFLDLGGTRVSDAGLEHLLGLDKLRALHLERTSVSDAGMAHLKKLPGLREVYLDETTVSDAGLRDLGETKNLVSLGLSRTNVSDAGLAHMRDQITTLILRNTGISDAGVAHLKGKDRLEVLDIAGTDITDRAVEALAGLPNLRVLDLSGTRITDSGVQLLRDAGGLEDLQLERTAVTDLGVEHLAALPRLTRVSLEGSRVTVQGKRLLNGKRPEVAVTLDQPWVEDTSLSRYSVRAGQTGDLAAGSTIAKLRELESTRSLRLHRPAFDSSVLVLLKDLPNLEHLDLRDTALDDAALAHFIGLQRILSLNLSRTRITDAGLVHLMDMQALTRLDLQGTTIQGEGLRHLEGLTRLHALNLSDSPISDEGAARVAALSALRKLELTNTRLTDQGARALGRLPNLRYLDLYGTRVTDDGLDSIGRMAELRYLYLNATDVSDAGLARLEGLKELVELGLDGTAVSDAGCVSLKAFPRLERLRIGNTSITDRGLEHMAALPALRTLELENTEVTDAGVGHLLRMTNLERLVLDGTAVTDAALVRLRGLEALESLSVHGTKVTEGGAAELRKHRPRTDVAFGREEPGPSVTGIAGTILYCAMALLICLYGLHRCRLTWLFARDREAGVPPAPAGRFTELPRVTVQLPMFNERRVLERVIDAACAIDYPRDRLQIQVLDDSTDESADLARASCERFRSAGFDIDYLHRGSRTGFKGGALEAGLASSTGEFIAILDADFVPSREILQQTIHHFTDPRVGMVQTEWAHLNRGESLLTECQALSLDAHFIIEQRTRFRNGRWFNFNGTAGVWRRRCIEEAGGWHHDTLTEDTDLSYRAQLGGWRFVYLPTVCSSAEIPSRMSAFLGQQNRWTQGLTQNAVKLLPRILRSRAPARVKAEAWFHLTSPLMYLVMFLLTAFALPAMFISMPLAGLGTLPALAIGMPILLLGTIAAAVFLIKSQHAQGRSLWRTAARLPAVMALGIGMSATNARAAMEGLLGVRGSFLRTPKFNGRMDFDLDPTAPRRRRVLAGWVELAAAGVMLACLVLSLTRPFTVIGAPFLLLFAIGYFWVGASSFHGAPVVPRGAAGPVKGSLLSVSRAGRFVLAGAMTALVGGAVLACAAVAGRPRPAGDEALSLGIDLALADWKHRGAALQGVAASSTGLDLDVALDQDRDAGEVFVELDGPLSPLGDSLASGREIRFTATYPPGFSGELQAFASTAGGASQYGSTVFVERHDALREETVVLSPGRLTPPMGYSDPGFDPGRGIRRIGLKVSAQSDRVRRPGYRPFHGLITISSVRVADRGPVMEPEVRTLPPGSAIAMPPPPIDLFLAQSGVDRPWPFGYAFSGPVSEAHREELRRGYEAVARRGLGFTRVYLGDFRTGLTFDEKGAVSGIEGQLLDYLDMLAEEANRQGIMVMLSLTDNTIADRKGVEHREIIADPVASERFVNNALVPIATRLEKRRVIFDIFNEPENVTEIPLRTVQQYVDLTIRRLRAAVPGAQLTVVSRSREELVYWRGRGLDLLSHNVFDRRTLEAATTRSGALDVDAPLFVAEMDPALATREALEALRMAGYQGAGLWGWGTEDKYAWRADDLERITAPLLEMAATRKER